ncbi:MAG: tripartite tricarboxylate transporter TctB family protein [Oscillospiraceae bacterium]|nr:tripartite tricarboxylate transporter TctB family protein [Oscillospiraceae bacterium]
MLKKYSDVFCGIFLILLGVGLYVLSFGIKSVALNLIKADFFPRLDAALFVILGAILAVSGFVKAKNAPAETEKEPPFWKNDGSVSMLETLALIAAYIWLMKPVGFVIDTVVYLIAQMIVLTPREKRTGKNIVLFALISVITAFVIYLLFTRVFYLMLPAGILHI